MSKNKRMRDLPRVERPREKLIAYGPDKLSEAELLAILLRTGPRGQNVLKLSEKLIKQFGVDKLPDTSFDELKACSGLGPAKACEIVACFELGKRLLTGKQTSLLLSPSQVWEELADIRQSRKEHFVVFFLNTKNQIIERETISIGTLNASLIHPREVFEPAIKHATAQIIVAHNHPSGDPAPSPEDDTITAKLKEAGTILGIELLDHVIVAKDEFYSYKDHNLC